MASNAPFRPAGLIAALALLAGCSSFSARGPVDPSAYASMGCNELNHAVAGVSNRISQTAITRGKVAETNVPTWVPGGTRVATKITDRQTARIERLQEEERAAVAARDSACARRQ
jgi:hypothetical protein